MPIPIKQRAIAVIVVLVLDLARCCPASTSAPFAVTTAAAQLRRRHRRPTHAARSACAFQAAPSPPSSPHPSSRRSSGRRRSGRFRSAAGWGAAPSARFALADDVDDEQLQQRGTDSNNDAPPLFVDGTQKCEDATADAASASSRSSRAAIVDRSFARVASSIGTMSGGVAKIDKAKGALDPASVGANGVSVGTTGDSGGSPIVAAALESDDEDTTAAAHAADDTRRINVAIVEWGRSFFAPASAKAATAAAAVKAEAGVAGGDTNAEDVDTNILQSALERVPGCVATVHVRTALIPLSDGDRSGGDDKAERYRVVLDGDADALLSGGLLALLSDALSGGLGLDGLFFSPVCMFSDLGEKEMDSEAEKGERDYIITAQDVLQWVEPSRVADMLGLRSVLSTGRNDGLASMTRVVQRQIAELLGAKKVVEQGVLQDEEQQILNGDTPQPRRPTVAMLLSGGVDSSVALNILVRQNYNVTAFYLKIWLEDELAHLGQCPWEDDYAVCRAVCEQVGVPLETVSLQEEYRKRVISYTVSEAEKGRTPNPDIMCNSRVKFGCFYDAIEGRGFDYVASGHYAQLVEADASSASSSISSSCSMKGLSNAQEGGRQRTNNMRLLRAPDPVKDQSYFLCALTQDQLRRVIFPIGGYQKSEVRALAQEFDLPNKDRPDSQGLCFLGKVKFDEFLEAYLGTRPGDIIDAATGNLIGRHNGLWYHTVGQRKGIGKVLNSIETSRGPWYIVAKDKERNAIIASNEYDEEAFEEARSDFYVEDITWISGSPPRQLVPEGHGGQRWKAGRLSMKIRHGPTIVEGTLHLDESNVEGAAGSVHLDVKDKGLAPGQFAVFYNLNDEECLGAGVISEQHWASFLSDNRQEDTRVQTR